MAQFTILIFSLALVFLASRGVTADEAAVKVIDFEDSYYREQVQLLTPELFKLLNIEDPERVAAQLRVLNLTSPVQEEGFHGSRDYNLKFVVSQHAIKTHFCNVGLAWSSSEPIEGESDLHIVNGLHCLGPPVLANQQN